MPRHLCDRASLRLLSLALRLGDPHGPDHDCRTCCQILRVLQDHTSGALARATPGRAGLACQSPDLGPRHDVEATDTVASNLATVDQATQPFGTVARLTGGICDQDQLVIPHEADDIAPRQYRTTPSLDLLAFPNYNIGEGQ